MLGKCPPKTDGHDGQRKMEKEMRALAKKEIKTKGKWVTKLKHEYYEYK